MSISNVLRMTRESCDRFIADLQADDLRERQHMRAAQVEVRVRRRKPVEVRAADGGEQQRIRLRATIR